MMEKKTDKVKGLFYWAARMGCHQKPERSFFYKGKQFPVCARCTGVYLGNILAIPLYWFEKPNVAVCFLCCFIMFGDWWLQFKNVLESTNRARFITGLMCGYGMTSLEILVIAFLISNIL